MSGKSTVVVGVYPTRAGADAAVEALKGNGFRDTDVSVLVPQTAGPGQTPETSGTGGPSKMPALLALEQSVWLDHLSRDHTRSGSLQALIDAGLRGQTSNPHPSSLRLRITDQSGRLGVVARVLSAQPQGRARTGDRCLARSEASVMSASQR